ncbi:uncharacterized protein LOC125836022 [Solanum verrucosum]|uniref:uncharacterized protein LOC125836022 n=1 Tax=Solanum verrucosum TaxID=315347 RepID=UPI0020D0FDC9|nr:uncharacterized protein LOC125836022 [Solanum verrucosum]
MGQPPDFRIHPMCKNQALNHLIFADNLMIFSKGHEESMQTIVEALNHFSKVTGLVANTDKSSIFIARVSDVVKERLLEMTSYVEVKEIDGKCREYLWDGTEGKKKTSLVAWDNICRPKQQGGSSIKSSTVRYSNLCHLKQNRTGNYDSDESFFGERR